MVFSTQRMKAATIKPTKSAMEDTRVLPAIPLLDVVAVAAPVKVSEASSVSVGSLAFFVNM
jgi:hypothetical protein